MSKPYHLMTPAERTAARIAQNRAISEKVGEGASPKPPVGSSREFIRGTREERAKSGSVIRKVQSRVAGQIGVTQTATRTGIARVEETGEADWPLHSVEGRRSRPQASQVGIRQVANR